MDFTPHTEEDLQAMLEVVGVESIDDLFEPVPEVLRLRGPLGLPGPMTEGEVLDLVAELAGRNRPTGSIGSPMGSPTGSIGSPIGSPMGSRGRAGELTCFAGGGAYDHYLPAAVRHLASRAEFSTSYTPYQPELSQGVLGALFEYQTMICELTGMDVANASLYDGASALVEAVNLAVAATGRPTVVVSEALNPNYRAVLETFGAGPGHRFTTAPAPSGVTRYPDLDGAACLVVAQPNFFGSVEDLAEAARRAHEAGALLVVSFDPLSAGLLEAPGALGADVVTGEGQPLSNALSYGGPYLGIFATRMSHVRQVPGRIVGATVDLDGRPGYVLTLQAREQHIRRERATSNVCTNQTLLAIAAAIYLSWLGPRGLAELGQACLARAQYAAEILSSVPGCRLAFDAPFFKEFVLRVPGRSDEVVSALADRGYLAGPALGALYPWLSDALVVAVTERRTPQEIEGLAKALAEAAA